MYCQLWDTARNRLRSDTVRADHFNDFYIDRGSSELTIEVASSFSSSKSTRHTNFIMRRHAAEHTLRRFLNPLHCHLKARVLLVLKLHHFSMRRFQGDLDLVLKHHQCAASVDNHGAGPRPSVQLVEARNIVVVGQVAEVLGDLEHVARAARQRRHEGRSLLYRCVEGGEFLGEGKPLLLVGAMMRGAKE